MSRPRHLFSAWGEIRRQARRAGRLALFTDLDGTLVPLRRKPHLVRIPAAVRRSLEGISAGGTLVGIISGRRLTDLRRLVAVRNVWYAGSHGFALQHPRKRRFICSTARQRRIVEQARRTLARILRRVPQVWTEKKDAAFAVHFRGASRRNAALAASAIRRVLAEFSGLRLLPGKKVWDVLPGGATDKSSAVRLILQRERRRHSRKRWLVFYLGDDTTDERVFRTLNGIPILVGRKRQTAARFYLQSPREVVQLLQRWGDLTQ